MLAVETGNGAADLGGRGKALVVEGGSDGAEESVFFGVWWYWWGDWRCGRCE